MYSLNVPVGTNASRPELIRETLQVTFGSFVFPDCSQRTRFGTPTVIRKIRHKGLKKVYEDDSAAKVNPDQADKLRRILARLDAASSPQDMDLPGYRLHELKGQREGRWSVRVSGNWRVTFRFEGGHATDVDFEDYH